MPSYEYEIHDGAGELLGTVTLIRPVGRRDRVGIRRRTVPRSVAVSGSAQRDPRGSALAGYHRAEQKLGSRFRSRFTPDQIKRAHAQSDS